MTRIASCLGALLAGVAVAVASVPLIGRTAAIAMPAAFAEWFRANASVEAGILVWDTLVIYGLGTGILLFAVAVAAIMWLRHGALLIAASVLAGVLLGAHVVIPVFYGSPVLVAPPWWSMGLELASLIAIGLAILAARVLQRTKGSREQAGAVP